MRLFILFFAISFFAPNCLAQAEFFSKREDLISTRPIVASINVNPDQNNSENENYNNEDTFNYNSESKKVSSKNLQGKKDIMGNPLGLIPKKRSTKKIASKKEVKKEINQIYVFLRKMYFGASKQKT